VSERRKDGSRGMRMSSGDSLGMYVWGVCVCGVGIV